MYSYFTPNNVSDFFTLTPHDYYIIEESIFHKIEYKQTHYKIPKKYFKMIEKLTFL